MRRIIILTITAALAALITAAPAMAGSSVISPDAIWADGNLFGTFGAASALPANAPANSFDQIFLVPGQMPVAEAAPGVGFNGGRWLPTPVTWNTAGYLIESYAELMMAAEMGDITIGSANYDAAFLCPLIP